MKRFLIVSLALAMTVGFVNLDFSQLIADPASVVTIGPDDADARRGGSSRSYSSPSRPRVSAPRVAPSKPKPRASAPKAAKPQARASGTSKPKATASRSTAATPKNNKRDAATKAQRRAPAPKEMTTQARAKTYGNRSRADVSRDRQQMNSRYDRRELDSRRHDDSFSPGFMAGVAVMSMANQNMFYYNHWATMSLARQQMLMSQNVGLQAHIAAQQAAGVAANPNYVPTGMDAGMMRNSAYVDAQYGVHRRSNAAAYFFGFVVLLIVFGLAYRVFFHREVV